MTIKGKALLVIERVAHYSCEDRFKFEVSTFIQSCSHSNWLWGEAHEVFSLMRYDTLPAPNQAYRMKVGDKIWVKVNYEVSYHQDYEGDLDVDMYFTKQKVIKRKRAK